VQKSPVLLYHGLTGAPAELQSVSRALRRAGYEVETPMLPGHGVDEATLLKTGWRDWLGACEQDLLRVTANGDQAFVGGLSMGAVLALALAEKYPERVKGVAAFAPTMRYDGWATPGGSWFIPIGKHLPFVNRWRFMERPPYGIKDERLRAVIEEMMFSGSTKDAGLPFMPGLSLASNLVLVNKVERQLHKVAAPVLLVHATEDDITHIRNAERLAAKVSGPVRKLYLENSYHLVTVDQERGKVAQATVAFFDELCAAGAEAPAKTSAA
jgi:carboxylesterase